MGLGGRIEADLRELGALYVGGQWLRKKEERRGRDECLSRSHLLEFESGSSQKASHAAPSVSSKKRSSREAILSVASLRGASKRMLPLAMTTTRSATAWTSERM